MRAIEADFARPLRPGRAAWLLAAVFAIAAIGAVAAAVHAKWRCAELQRRAMEADMRLTEQQTRLSRAAIAARALSPREQAMRAERAAPWPEALRAVESVQSASVAPRSLTYEAAGMSIRLEVEYDRYASVLDYVETLNLGLPEGAAAWRWSVIRAEKGSERMSGTAVMTGRWGR